MLRQIFLIFGVCFIIGVTLGEVPSYIKICGRRNPQLNECVRNSVEQLRDKIKSGIPELDVPAAEPFYLPEGLPLADSPDLKAYAKDIKLYGISKFNLDSVNVDLDKKKIDVTVHFDKIRLEGDYDVTAKIVVPITAQGPIELETQNIGGSAVLRYETRKTKKGERIFFSSMSLKMKIIDFTSKFIARAGADATFGEAINAVLNDNRQDIIAGVQPALEKAVSAKFLDMANQIVKHFTFEELFPDRE